jgi:gluconolactonase
MTDTNQLANVSFTSLHPSFDAILGAEPSITLLKEDPDGIARFHEACIYHPPTKSIFITSNQLPSSYGQTYNTTSDNKVILTQVVDNDDSAAATSKDVTPRDLINANGGAIYESRLVFCAQGNKGNSPPGGLVFIPDLTSTSDTQNLISTFQGRTFNSPNDLVVHPQDGSIWFTDPSYGYPQNIRPPPELPSQVYRFDPETKSIRAVADGFDRPNGLCFSPNRKVLYVTDTGAINGASNIPFDKTGKASIYAFDILESKNGG